MKRRIARVGPGELQAFLLPLLMRVTVSTHNQNDDWNYNQEYHRETNGDARK